MGDDEAKKRILARRATFVAAALAGISTNACDAPPFACLEPPRVDGAIAAAGDGAPPTVAATDAGELPQVCLRIRVAPPDGGPSSAP